MKSPEMLPEYLGPYKIESTLGEGGMGKVYRGHHAKTGEPVAIKIIADAIANQERFRRRFAVEVETLERLTHPHIVKLIGFGEEAGRLFYSMEFVDGESLHQKIKRDGRLDWQTTVRYAREVSAALKHAHDIGVIHRDIKPANLLITKQDSIKMTDFGIAKLYGSSEETAMGSVLGTADYMPPEQAEGNRVTARSDLYALGALMYVCLSGKSPHAAKSVPEVLYNVRYKVPDSLRDRFDVPKELDILILELLEKDPKKRPPTALVVLNRLSAMQLGLERMSNRERQRKESQLDDSYDLAELIEDEDLKRPSTTPGFETRAVDLNNRTKKPSEKSYDVTLASNELIAASHMGHTTDVATHLSELPGSGSQSDELASGKSHFTAVAPGAKPRRSSTFQHSQEDEVSWTSYVSIAALSLALVGCIAGIFYATRKPSADALYQQVANSLERDASLETMEGYLEEFEANYPDDKRLEEFAGIQAEISMQRRVDSLSRHLRRGGEQSLDPVELAFVEAMSLRDNAPELAIEKISSMLVVFQDQSLLTPSQRELVEYARSEKLRLTKDSVMVDSKVADFLQSQLDAAVKLDEASRADFYRSVIALYEDRPSAKSAVQRAKIALDKLAK